MGLVIHGLTKRFGTVQALDGVTLTVERDRAASRRRVGAAVPNGRTTRRAVARDEPAQPPVWKSRRTMMTRMIPAIAQTAAWRGPVRPLATTAAPGTTPTASTP